MSEALEILKSCDAFLEGHFLLSSGRHSSAYCQMAYLQQYPDRCAEVMKTVADKVKEMDVDVIVGPAMGGIATGRDALEFIMAGAAAVQVGAANFANPRAMETIADEMTAWMDKNGVKTLDEIRGCARNAE